MNKFFLLYSFLVLQSVVLIFHIKYRRKSSFREPDLKSNIKLHNIIRLAPPRGKIFFSELHGIVSEQIISILKDPEFPHRIECVMQQNVGGYIDYIQRPYRKYLQDFDIFGKLCDRFFCYGDEKTVAREVHKNAKHQSLDDFQLIIGGYPPAMSHYFLGLSISTITLLTVPFYDRIENLDMMKQFLQTQKQLQDSTDPKHLILANNHFSSQHFEHFSGIKSDVYWGYPNYVGNHLWIGQKSNKILISRHQPAHISTTLSTLWRPERKTSGGLKFIQAGENQGEFSNIVKFRAVVFFPYVPSVMAFFEFYKMGMPMFAPSKAFLSESKRDNTEDWYAFSTQFRKLKAMAHALQVPTSTFEKDKAYWISLFDIYQLPCLVYFDSLPHLAQQIKHNLQKTNEIHRCMMDYNVLWKKNNIQFWKNTLESLFPLQMNKDTGNMELVMTKREIPQDFDQYTQQYDWHNFEMKNSTFLKWKN